MGYAVRMRFTKTQALGNDFIAVNGFVEPPRDWPAVAVAACDRRFGIGADGLFVALPSETADVRMLFLNPDGTEDRCGNGLRCFARFLADEGISNCCEWLVETFGGPVPVTAVFRDGVLETATVDLGAPVLDAPAIPTALPPGRALDVPLSVNGRHYIAHCVSTGTPHAVIFVDELPADDVFYADSPLLEKHPLFPDRINVMWTRLDTRDRATIRIWERATGETLGCGTGAAAVAVVTLLKGLGDGRITVASPGGEVEACWDGAASLTLKGGCEVVYVGTWNPGDR